MKTTLDYIEDAKKALGIDSDYAIAKWLGTTRQTLNNWRKGRQILDDYSALKIAEALGVPQLQIIAQANAEREKDTQRKAFWERVAQSTTMGLFALAVSGPVPHTVNAGTVVKSTDYVLCAMKRRRHPRRAAA